MHVPVLPLVLGAITASLVLTGTVLALTGPAPARDLGGATLDRTTVDRAPTSTWPSPGTDATPRRTARPPSETPWHGLQRQDCESARCGRTWRSATTGPSTRRPTRGWCAARSRPWRPSGCRSASTAARGTGSGSPATQLTIPVWKALPDGRRIVYGCGGPGFGGRTPDLVQAVFSAPDGHQVDGDLVCALRPDLLRVLG